MSDIARCRITVPASDPDGIRDIFYQEVIRRKNDSGIQFLDSPEGPGSTYFYAIGDVAAMQRLIGTKQAKLQASSPEI